MRIAGNMAANTLDHMTNFVKPGITTQELDREAEKYMRELGGVPAFKGYQDFPNSVCISVNDELVHCIPSSLELKDGDIVTLDLGVTYDGFCSDTAKTFLVGDVEERTKRLVAVGYEALKAGIRQAIDGNYVADIANATYDVIRQSRYGAVSGYCGHGIGKKVHEMPQIPCVKMQNNGPILKNGMVICIEPMLTLNPSGKIRQEGRWKVASLDGCKTAHWEHTVAITPDGPEVLTLRQDEEKI